MNPDPKIAAFDVHYAADGRASAAAVFFCDYGDAKPAAVVTRILPAVPADYIPGKFYRRELPCILSLLRQIGHAPAVMIVDGYVKLGDRAGLGQHLFDACQGDIPVIGVAKSKYAGACGREVFRGKSLRPLYVTAAGMSCEKAALSVQRMHGAHRLPTLLRAADRAARDALPPSL